MNLFYYVHRSNKSMEKIAPAVIGYFEITAVFEGELEYIINGERVTLGARDVIFVPRGAVRERRPFSGTNYVSLNFLSDTSPELPIYMPGALGEIVRLILETLDGIWRYTHHTEDERFNLLLACLVRQLEVQLRAGREDPLVFKIKSFIKKNLSKRLTLAEISAHTFFSPAHCEKIFKRETGSSIIAYVLSVRVDTARALIREGTLSLSKIAEETGFSDYNYFSRSFKKITGQSPMSYKKSVLAL